MYVQPLLLGWTDICLTPSFRLDICMSKLITGVGHMCVQADNGGWTYVCWTYVCQLGHAYVQPGQTYVQPDYGF